VRRTVSILLAAALLLPAAESKKQQSSDWLLDAMHEEIERSRSLKIASLDAPYFISYELEDLDALTISATLGGVIESRQERVRIPRVQVRVGDYKFDNTNYLYSDFFQGPRFDADRVILDDNPAALRAHFWLATDRAFKGSVEAIARKRSALKNVASTESLNDFAKAEPVQLLLPVKKSPPDEAAWTARTKAVSAVFLKHPAVLLSGTEFQSSQVATYYANSEGTVIRTPDFLASFRVRASAIAPDGTPLRDGIQFNGQTAGDLPDEAGLRKSAEEIAANVEALIAAPAGEAYSGPVLFEPQAAAQLMAQIMQNLAPVRRPVNEPGRNFPVQASEFEGREGSKVMPEFLDVVDDPTQTEFQGKPLFGHYLVDMEGVKPQPLTLIEKGVLKNFLLTRQPVRGHEGSNGRGRLPGNFGAYQAAFGNLFVRCSQPVPSAELKKRLMETISQRGKPYGLIVRKLDFPSSASRDELRRTFGGAQGASGRLISAPLLVYRLYPDGKEELVRGLRFRSLNARSLRDITAASGDAFVFDYLENGMPLAAAGGGGYVANTSVVAPALLFDDLELEKVEAEWPRPPVVPAPALTAVR
jgi:hypothetical protein